MSLNVTKYLFDDIKYLEGSDRDMGHDFSELYSQYPEIIARMPEKFTSHEFILELARLNQRLYIEALYSYRDKPHQGGDAPFMFVHRILAQHLSSLPEIVSHVGQGPSKDIFGQPNDCARWQKL